jgi:hypothetical protein
VSGDSQKSGEMESSNEEMKGSRGGYGDQFNFRH